MTARPGLFIANGSAGVSAPQDTRLALAGLLAGEPGVLAGTGGAVTGSSSGPNMQYIVPASVFATVRGVLTTDGSYLWANDGNITVNTATPAPGSGTRYDLIWARALNANDGFGDANSTPVLGFTVGTASGSPVKPYASVPAGAYVLAESLVGTSIANASLATITQVSGSVVAAGGVLPVANSTVRDALPGKYAGQSVYRQDTGNVEVYNGTTWDVMVVPVSQEVSLSAQTLLNSTQTLISSLTSVHKEGAPSPWNLSTGVWTCPGDWFYTFSGLVVMSGGVAGTRLIFAARSGPTVSAGTYYALADIPAGGTSGTINFSATRWITAGTTVHFEVFQSSGSTRTVDNTISFLSITRR